MQNGEFDIVMGNLEDISHRDVWFICYRPQISLLMSGSEDNHLAALMLMWPCIERAFTLYDPKFDPTKNGGNLQGITDNMLLWILGSAKAVGNEHDSKMEIVKILRKSLVNGLKHDSFMRPPVLLEDKVQSYVRMEEKQGAEPTLRQMFTYRFAIEYNGQDLIIAPTSFWHLVRYRIDKFYIEEYDKSENEIG